MRLKILLVPFLIILVLVLAIGFIQPDIALIQAKKIEIQTKEAKVEGVETIIANIGLLSSSLDKEKAKENFVRNYFPETMDQERVIDSLNFSAVQSGVLVENMEVFQPAESVALAEMNAAGQEVSVGINPDGTPINPDGTPLSSDPAPKTFTTKITVRGNYENIKNFISRVAHINRFYTLNGFSAGLADNDVDSEAPDINALQGTFYADFDYLKSEKNYSALSNDIFKQQTIEFSSLQPTIDWVTNNVPLLEKPTTGKPNPFQ